MSKSDVQLIQKQFLSCVPILRIDFPHKIDINEQKSIFETTVGDALVEKYPIKFKYQQKFLRKLVEKLEHHGEEIYDNFYPKLCNLLTTEVENSTETHFRHFLMGHSAKCERLIIEESKSLISEGTTGLCSWQAALVLAEWCLQHQNQINAKKILELGSGVGLTGLTVLHHCSPQEFTFTDCHPAVLNLLRSNVELNALNSQGKWRIRDLPWETVDETVGDEFTPDVVIAADVVYDSVLFLPLINTLRIFFDRKNSYGVFAMTVRNMETILEFLQQLGNHGFVWEELDTPEFSLFLKPDETPVKIIKISSLS